MHHRLILALGILTMAVAASQAGNAPRPFIYGMNPIGSKEIGRGPEHDERMYRAIADAGGTIVRIGFNWDQIEPVKGRFDWAYLDRQVELAIDNNLAIVGLINSTPGFASPTGAGTPFYAPKEESARDFKGFVRRLASRYKGRIVYWEFWNEANGFGWHHDQGYNRAEEYVPWLKRCYRVLKSVDQTNLVGLTGMDDADGHAPVYLKKVYDLGGRGYFDAVVVHPYAKGGEYTPDKLLALRKLMDEHGDKALPIWITEMGWDVKGREDRVPGYISGYFRSLTDPSFGYVPIATYHTICDFSTGEWYGLMDMDLHPRPGYETFRSLPKENRPVISNVSVDARKGGVVLVSFQTDMPTRGTVLYGLTRNHGLTARETTHPRRSHVVRLDGLDPGHAYHLRIRADASAYNLSFSRGTSFRAE